MIGFLVFFPILFALTLYPISKKLPSCRQPLFVFASGACLVASVLLAFVIGDAQTHLALGVGLSFSSDAFRSLYCVITSLLWFCTSVFSAEYMRGEEHRNSYVFFSLVTLGGVLGVFLSDSFDTTFVFFEIMSFASFPLVAQERTEGAIKAAKTYLAIAVVSGMLLLTGLFFLYRESGTLHFVALREYYRLHTPSAATFAAGILVLLGFGAKAGMYPLHIWLPKAHPVAPSPASALLSGILTKTGVFGLIALCANVFAYDRVFPLILLSLAVVTMFWGAFLALCSDNLKKTLACSSMSQIGFILTGLSFTVLLGEEGGLAQAGTLLHMANHSLIKLVLFLCAGVVVMNVHSLDLDRIRGYGRKKPLLAVLFAIGALGIMGIPGFNGYVSKTMIHEGITEYISVLSAEGAATAPMRAVEWIFLISGGLTVAYMTKLFICLFVSANKDPVLQAQMDGQNRYMSVASALSVGVGALLIPPIGLFPSFTVRRFIAPAAEFFHTEPLPHTPAFFSFECIGGALISIGIGAAVYGLAVLPKTRVRGYRTLLTSRADLEDVCYRPILIDGTQGFCSRILAPISRLPEFLFIDGTLFLCSYVLRFFALCFDGVILLLSKTVCRPYVYRYTEEPMSVKVGHLIAKWNKRKSAKEYSQNIQTVENSLSAAFAYEYNSFAFAFAMIFLGIVVVLVCVMFLHS